MLNKVNSKAQLIKAIEQRGFKFVSAVYYPEYKNCETLCWDLNIEFQGQNYYLEANSLQGLLDEVEMQLL